MMNNNKILTVSYGTFSCTLEGFDNSFATMKAIAEYFRDLASDDRYFGAEPPQPDAEMLARIAEREISRRVDAREHEGRIVLSASDAQSPEASATAPEETDAVVAQPITPDAPDSPVIEIEPLDDSKAAVGPADAAALATAAGAAAVATHVVAETVQARAAGDFDADADADADAESVAVVDAKETEDDDAPEQTADAFQDADTLEDDAAADLAADKDVEMDVAVDAVPAEDADTPAPVAADSIAAKLQRIRAVVSQSQQDQEDDELFEDEHAEAFGTEDTPDAAPAPGVIGAIDAKAVVEDAARDIEDAFQVDEDSAADADEIDDDDDDIAAILARLDSDHSNAAPEATKVSVEDPDDGNEDPGLDTLAALMAADQDDAEDAITGDGDAKDNIFDEAPEPEAPRRARVIKVKRADIDAALASGKLEEVDAEEDEASTLSDQDEAELMAELAQVEAELPAEDTVEPTTKAGARAPTSDTATEVKDDDVSRLMAEADNQMDEPESSGRRNAFAHLKAAVKAKKADADIGNDSIKDEGAFRSDLASVVKPRRPEAGSTRSERPDEARPAPLKLVAEQRVDVQSKPVGPVRPRRVAAIAEVTTEPSVEGSFADYAAELGAHELPALLEAAASYLSFVEGRDQFSRPQLMNKVRQVEQDDFSREDGLRSFGQLLRTGKIEKMKGGRFAVTNDIGFRPDQRAAG